MPRTCTTANSMSTASTVALPQTKDPAASRLVFGRVMHCATLLWLSVHSCRTKHAVDSPPKQLLHATSTTTATVQGWLPAPKCRRPKCACHNKLTIHSAHLQTCTGVAIQAAASCNHARRHAAKGPHQICKLLPRQQLLQF